MLKRIFQSIFGVTLIAGFVACTADVTDSNGSEDANGVAQNGTEENVGEAKEAAEVNQLCRTNSDATLFTSPTGGYYVPSNSLVRILGYEGPYHYLARWNGLTGQLERSRVIQSSCYYQ